MQVHLGGVGLAILTGLFAASPSGGTYMLKSYEIGGGGGSGSSSSYNLNASVGSQSGDPAGSATYGVKSGDAPTTDSNVPPAPTLTNPSSYYDRLRLVVNTGNNPSDARYAIAISPDNFATTTRYVKADNSIGTTLTLADYKTYTNWGGASGFLITGLQQGTTYTVKVKAMQGRFTESAYGPMASAATVLPSITFAVETTGTAIPPFTINFNGLALGSVFNASDDASISISTNALSGGSIYVKDVNAGLSSSAAGYTITSATADLNSASRGYGAIVTAAGQVSGGPLTAAAPFNGAGNNVGSIATSLQTIASTSAPITTGSLTVRFKAKTDLNVPAATDYTDILTFVAAMSF